MGMHPRPYFFTGVYARLRRVLGRNFCGREKLTPAESEQLRRQKTMDTFSASLAHEIINPVYAIAGLTGVVKERLLDNPALQLSAVDRAYFDQRLGQIYELSQRIEKMIKAIREFSAQTGDELTRLKLNDVFEGFFLIIEPQLKEKGVNVVLEGDPDIHINANKILLEEVFINITINAIYAIGLQNPSYPEIIISIIPDPDSKRLRLVFKDNGCGIPKRLLEDIFLDFVTTKGSSEGLGMGLSRARRILAMHQGKIWAASEGEGQGATILVELPYERRAENLA